jgi:hypothetical protein
MDHDHVRRAKTVRDGGPGPSIGPADELLDERNACPMGTLAR